MPDFSQLTERQREIYDFIRQKIESRGYGPTVREIGLAFDIKSPNGVMCHLKALEKKGLIKREGFSARAIQLLDVRLHDSGLPLLGQVAAGMPRLLDILKTHEYVQGLDAQDGRVRCRWTTGRERLPELHRRIVNDGVELIALAVKTDNLEDIYMKISGHRTS